MPRITPLLITAMLALATPALAQWPTTLEENLPVAASPNYNEMYPVALPYPGGSTLVAFLKSMPDQTVYYQIINRYGQLLFQNAQPLTPALLDPGSAPPLLISDGQGGALAAWYVVQGGLFPGYYVQRLDSLGNRLWGDAGVRLTAWNSPLPDLDISVDGQGGFFLSSMYSFPTNGIWAQHLNGEGQPLWGDGGLVLIPATPWGEGWPQITYDGRGGMYMVWHDGRPPITPYGHLYMQHWDANAHPTWTPGGIFIYEDPFYEEVIPDGMGGFLLHCGRGGLNYAFRVDSNGNILWERDPVSWFQDAEMVRGDTGFVYLGFAHTGDIHAQKMNIRGRTYWLVPGGIKGTVMMASPPGLGHGSPDFDYLYPYFYGVVTFARLPQYSPRLLNVQVMDSLGNRIFGREGVTLTYTVNTPISPYMIDVNVVPDGEGGVVAVWEQTDGGGIRDIYAKHVNADGSLGGPIYTPTGPKSAAPPGRAVKILSVQGDAITYTLMRPGAVKLEVFDILGRKVATLQHEYQTAGTHTVGWEKKNLASGIYLLKLSTPDDHQLLKIAIVH